MLGKLHQGALSDTPLLPSSQVLGPRPGVNDWEGHPSSLPGATRPTGLQENKSKRWDNSAFTPATGLRKSFHPWISFATSCCWTAACTASRTVVSACQCLAFRCTGQPCRMANLCLAVSCRQTSSNVAHSAVHFAESSCCALGARRDTSWNH